MNIEQGMMNVEVNTERTVKCDNALHNSVFNVQYSILPELDFLTLNKSKLC